MVKLKYVAAVIGALFTLVFSAQSESAIYETGRTIQISEPLLSEQEFLVSWDLNLWNTGAFCFPCNFIGNSTYNLSVIITNQAGLNFNVNSGSITLSPIFYDYDYISGYPQQYYFGDISFYGSTYFLTNLIGVPDENGIRTFRVYAFVDGGDSAGGWYPYAEMLSLEPVPVPASIWFFLSGIGVLIKYTFFKRTFT